MQVKGKPLTEYWSELDICVVLVFGAYVTHGEFRAILVWIVSWESTFSVVMS